MKKKWLLIFPDNWLSYSPSCLNFVKMLEENGIECIVIYMDDHCCDNSGLEIEYKPVYVNRIIRKLLSLIGLFDIYKMVRLFFFSKSLDKKINFDRFVGFDDCGYLPAYWIDRRAIYFSLEISKSIYNKIIKKFIDVKLLIIQTIERRNYLNDKCLNVAYIQNSPIVKQKILRREKHKGRLIYFGNVNESKALNIIIDVLYHINDTTLLIKGLRNSNGNYVRSLEKTHEKLIQSGRLKFDFKYINQDDIAEFLQDFDIGFSFFSEELINKCDYNILSSPNGKVFNYFMAGLPVIGNNIVGMNPVVKFNAGCLLDDLSGVSVSNAVRRIFDNYSKFSDNALKASLEYNFEKMFNSNKQLILAPYQGS